MINYTLNNNLDILNNYGRQERTILNRLRQVYGRYEKNKKGELVLRENFPVKFFSELPKKHKNWKNKKEMKLYKKGKLND